MRWLMIPAILAIGLPSSCQGTHEVVLPPSKECPSGVWTVTSKGDQTSAVCKDKPIPSPTTEPSASPEPVPSATPSIPPTPKPSPTSTPSLPPPSPIPTASPSTTSGIPVKDGQCPANYPRKPDHVKVGGTARRAPANPFAWLINLSPLMNADNGTCLDTAGNVRTYPGYPGMCEQWTPCALQGLHDDANPLSSWEAAVYAEGPGFPWDNVERRSRDAADWEPPCPDDNKHCYINYYLGNLVLGEHGSPPGKYKVCAAPTVAELRGPNGECKEFELTLP